jgi:hypothetical protein
MDLPIIALEGKYVSADIITSFIMEQVSTPHALAGGAGYGASAIRADASGDPFGGAIMRLAGTPASIST